MGTTMRRQRKLDSQVLRLLREIRALEQDPNVKIDPLNKLDAAMNDAAMNDDPSQLQDVLSSIPSKQSSHRVEEIINKRPELTILEIKNKISQCKQQTKKGGGNN